MSTKSKKNKEEVVEENIDQTTPEQDSVESNETEASTSNEESEKDPLEELTKQLEEQKDQNLRLYAEFENFRRRTAKEKIDMMTTANEGLMTALLPVLDDFDRALKNMKDVNAQEQVLEGVELIQSKFTKTLEAKGLKEMESSIEKEFDVDVMEAITKIPAPTPDMAGKVIDEVEKGYKLGEKILRFPKVVVAEKG